MHNKLRLESPTWEQLWVQVRALASLAMITRPLCHGQNRGTWSGEGPRRGDDGNAPQRRQTKKKTKSTTEPRFNAGQRLRRRNGQTMPSSHAVQTQQGHTEQQVQQVQPEQPRAVSSQVSCSWFGRGDGWGADEKNGQVNGSANHIKHQAAIFSALAVLFCPVLSSLPSSLLPTHLACQLAVLPHQHHAQ